MSLKLTLLAVAPAAALALAASGAAAQLPDALTPPPPAATSATPPPAPRAPAPAPIPAPAPAPAPAPVPPPAAPLPAAPPPAAALEPPPAPVSAAPLQAPDLFSPDAGKPTGLPEDLWKGTSLDLARTVMPMAVTRPMSPAARAFALRLMTTSARAPDGAAQDADLAAARIYVVLSLGDPVGARTMLEHTPGVRQSAALSQVAAETDLVLGREDEACSLGDNLVAGKDSPYFRRLRAYCLYKAGDRAGAQLAFDLTAEQAKDEVYKRLMGAAVGEIPAAQAGPASLRNGIEYALSRRMGLDLQPALPAAWAPIVTMLAQDPTAPAPLQGAAAGLIARRQADMSRAASLNPAVRDAAQSLAAGNLSPDVAERLAAAGAAGSPEAQQALALYAAAGAPGYARVRAAFARFDIGPAKANQARMLELDALSAQGAKGETALLALWLMMDAGEAGPVPADRARITRALTLGGFPEDARRYALEGILGVQPPPPPPPPPPPKAVKKPPHKAVHRRPERRRRPETSGD